MWTDHVNFGSGALILSAILDNNRLITAAYFVSNLHIFSFDFGYNVFINSGKM